jgi:hypothetical protein
MREASGHPERQARAIAYAFKLGESTGLAGVRVEIGGLRDSTAQGSANVTNEMGAVREGMRRYPIGMVRLFQQFSAEVTSAETCMLKWAVGTILSAFVMHRARSRPGSKRGFAPTFDRAP